eukprot:CAMPEP_0175859574 /NCGR_PEP_ID=MMETSP0107_2-20121207/30335_1 /TAXON_ID=195067 ORGANISM="Goniomonas pacifica, Strain CCMP1869" /NCGR_SAMPLE_ID=MMETSP0107_2 /ASSEMBLY_ACC=CAM_ASM_000203 /LENGTH=82 /DNA_ID=CAMNT_0017176217 /DNA_START=9 /DNA_END=254 /DNA_ORIENTATION=-
MARGPGAKRGKGAQLRKQTKEMIVHMYEKLIQERKDLRFLSGRPPCPRKRLAFLSGWSEVTIGRVWAEYRRHGQLRSPKRRR